MNRPYHRLGLRDIGLLALRHDESDWVAEGIDGGVNLGTEAAHGAAKGLRGLPPSFPAAC